MADESDNTRPSLLLRLRDPADAESWQCFMQLYGPLILQFARRRGLQEADAADIAQEVATQVVRSIRSFEYQPERGRFRDWLGTVVRHRVGRFFKRQAGRAKGADADWLNDLPSVEQDSEWSAEFNAHVLSAAMERAKPGFEESTWEAFRLAWVDQVPAATVAERLKLSVASVYLAKSRVLKRLREEVVVLAEDWPLQPA